MKQERIEILRAIEADCYGVCLYMLQEEKSAAKAAQAVLTDLYRDTEFWLISPAERERSVRRTAISKSLEWRGKLQSCPV